MGAGCGGTVVRHTERRGREDGHEQKAGREMRTIAQGALDGLGSRIRGLRQARGWSQMVLAFEATMSQSHLAGIECGERKNIEVKTLLKLAEALGTTPNELLGYPE